MVSDNERRRTYFINTPFQVRFIIKFTVLLVLGLVVSAVMFYLMSNRSLTESMSYGHTRMQLKNTYDLLLPGVIITTLISSVVVSIIGILVFVRVSHKLAGPLYRFEKRAQRISQGDLTVEEIKLRKNDEIVALGDSFSDMTKTLKRQIALIKRETSGLSDLARDLESSAAEHNSPERKELAARLNEIIERIKTSTDYFKV